MSLIIIIAIVFGLRFLIYSRINNFVPGANTKTKNHLVNCSSTHILICLLISFLINMGGEYVFKIDSFRNLRTWIPFLGGDMGVVDLLGQYIDIPEAERSEGMQRLVNVFGSVSQLSSICLLGSIILGVLVFFLIKARRGKEIVRLSVYASHVWSILAIYCAFHFYNTFSDYLWGLGGQINYLFLLIPACIAAYDIYYLNTKTLCDPGLAFKDEWVFDGKDSLRQVAHKSSSKQESPMGEIESQFTPANEQSPVIEETNSTSDVKNKKRNNALVWGIPIGAALFVVAFIVLQNNPIRYTDESEDSGNKATLTITDITEKDYSKRIAKVSKPEQAAVLLISRLFTALAHEEYDGLYSLFAYQVNHYLEEKNRFEVVSFWRGLSNLTLSVDGNMDIVSSSDSRVEVGFDLKAINENHEAAYFPFYIIVDKGDDGWRIIAEGQYQTEDDNIRLIEEFYGYVLDITKGRWNINDYLSPGLARRIWETEYEGTYSIWVFRTGYQDGYDEPSKILSISPTQNGWYEVKYSDMGILGKTMVHMTNGKIDDYIAFDKNFQY